MSKTILRVTRSQIGKKVRFALINNPDVYQNPHITNVRVYDGGALIDELNPDTCYYRNGSIDSPGIQDWIVEHNLYRQGQSPIGLVLCDFKEYDEVHEYTIIKVLSLRQKYKNPKIYLVGNGLEDIISLFED